MMETVEALRNRLQSLHALTAQTPLFNPVFQLSLDISRDLESRKIDLSGVSAWIRELECEALQSRAAGISRLVGPVDIEANQSAIRALADGHHDRFEDFAARWEKPLLHVVFTGHPTFLLTPDQAEAVAIAASTGDDSPATLCVVDPFRPAITLAAEHLQAIDAMCRAAEARDTMIRILFETARDRWPERWRELRPMPWRLATWVGYDMDGRTDIGWATSIGFRLQEKSVRLAGYVKALADLPSASAMRGRLIAAEEHSRAMAEVFSRNLDHPDSLSAAANRLTAENSARLLSLRPIIEEMESLAEGAGDDEAQRLLGVSAAMRADGLGLGGIHFRVNAAQLHNAIRRRIDPDNSLDLGSGTALKRLRVLIDEAVPLRSNFAALAIENTTALRQFLAMAQILHHVDADAPIRMLIAECEEPQTVLAALYFARLFGIEDRVDVSPLFETESAMEHGARFLDALLGEPAYQAYARRRGRVSIQTGFSDAGRFIGQLPAALAIERLQGRLARIMARHGLTDVAALIFNTHGESMGRGAHPASMRDRLRHPLSDWARAQFRAENIRIEPEVSFQGGDGFLYFRTPELALSTLTRVAEVELAESPSGQDPFYERTDLSLDFYRGIRRVQREHLASRTYARAITAFGLGLLNQTGSRKSRRQSDLASDREMSLRQIRAIPHNAILQQLGYPVNVLSGAGTAAGDDVEEISDLIGRSERGRQLFRLLRAANRLASIKTVAAHGELFNSAYWASRTYRGSEPHLESACLALAERLTNDDRTGVFRRLASRLRVDGLKFHRLLARVRQQEDDGGDATMQEVRRTLGVLQAIRLALLQHMFLRVVQVPAFSRSNDISRDDVLEMVFTLRIDDAVSQLRRAFPVEAPALSDFTVNEPTDYPDGDDQAYAGIQAAYIDPIAEAHVLCLRIGTAIANHFGAHG